MALEEELLARMRLHCPRVISPTAPYGTARPYLTWQHIGGTALRFLDNSAPDKRNAFIQVNAWADSKKAAFDLLRAVEAELCAIAPGVGFVASPIEEPSDAYIEGDEGQVVAPSLTPDSYTPGASPAQVATGCSSLSHPG